MNFSGRSVRLASLVIGKSRSCFRLFRIASRLEMGSNLEDRLFLRNCFAFGSRFDHGRSATKSQRRSCGSRNNSFQCWRHVGFLKLSRGRPAIQITGDRIHGLLQGLCAHVITKARQACQSITWAMPIPSGPRTMPYLSGISMRCPPSVFAAA